ncbi:hybrid sensor histidine kinase/response regulator [Pseudomonas oryzihabitans]|uniref:hybrid sensor histidine kinase/response regulator n=1 Tax=Pseudomonas oryzihabitans TaxID=47885 RepID=UPI000ECE89D3|nr:ATP-binding protein [Pseudomonas oryzihabitans]HCV75504.1 hybrid sensor histidine kinase/response regulator [Pseudomonas sp.]
MPPTKSRPAQLVPLRNRLLAIAFAGIVPLALVAGLGLWLLVHHQQHEAEQRALESSRQAATTIESELRRSVTILQALAESPLLATADLEGFTTLVERVLPLVPGWRTVLLATPDGQVVRRISTQHRQPAGPLAEPESFAEVVAQRRPVIGQLGKGPSGQFAFPVRVPVQRHGQLDFVLTAVMTPESIRVARMTRSLPRNWVGSVFDRRGLRIARTNLHDETLGQGATPGLAKLLAQPGDEGVGLARTREGQDVYTAFVRLPESGWVVTTAIPTEEVTAAANRSFALYGGGLVLSVAFAWAVALLLSRRISQPVQALQEAAQALGQRQPPVLPDSDVLEIRQVGEALLAAADARRLLEEERDDYLRGLQLSQEQLQLQVADLEVLQRLNHRLLQLPSLPQQLQEILEVLCHFHQTSLGCVSLLEDGKPPQLYFAPGFAAEEQLQLAALQPEDSACAAVLRSGSRVVIPDLATAAEFAALATLGRRLGFAALHAVPLRSTLHGTLGAITVHLPEAREPTPRQQRLADLCASKAALVIDRARIQEAALRSQRRLRVALESSQVSFGIAVPAAEGGFTWDYLNPMGAATLGLDGSGATPCLPWAGTRILRLCGGHQADEAAWSVEAQGPGASGANRWLQISATPFDGNVAVWFLDISERKRQEQQLRDNDRQKDEFLAVLAHELRNPLAPIRHAAALIAAPQVSPEQQQRSCETIERQVERMGALLNDLLDISRITFGRITLHNTFVTLQTVLQAAADAAQAPMQDKGQSFVLQIPEAPLWLYADPLRLEQIFVNLLGNAARYTPAGGRITLSVWAGDDEVRVEIADNGFGIAPERLTDLFQMFGQIDPRLAERSPGLGIGLALSRELARLQGGDITATSAGLGQGSRFTVSLPLTVAPPAVVPETATAAPARPATRRILVADDNPDIADTIAELLELDGHEVRVVYDGQAALTLFQSYGPDIVISDIGMPGLTGHQLARAIRETPTGQAVKLIAMTGWGQAQDKAEALAAGFDHHLTKPADIQTLYALVGG